MCECPFNVYQKYICTRFCESLRPHGQPQCFHYLVLLLERRVVLAIRNCSSHEEWRVLHLMDWMRSCAWISLLRRHFHALRTVKSSGMLNFRWIETFSLGHTNPIIVVPGSTGTRVPGTLHVSKIHTSLLKYRYGYLVSCIRWYSSIPGNSKSALPFGHLNLHLETSKSSDELVEFLFELEVASPLGANAHPTDIQVQHCQPFFPVENACSYVLFSWIGHFITAEHTIHNSGCTACLAWAHATLISRISTMRSTSRNTNDHPIQLSNVSSSSCISSDSNNISTNLSSQRRPKRLLPIDFEPSDADVICGKGKNAFLHEGNCRFRRILEQHLHAYHQADTREKRSVVVDTIIGLVRKDCVNGGGFVRQDENGRWWEIGCASAKEKIGHSIRDSLMHSEPFKKAERQRLRASNKARRNAVKRKNKGLSQVDLLQTPPCSLGDQIGIESLQDLMRSAPLHPSTATSLILNTAPAKIDIGLDDDLVGVIPPPPKLVTQSSNEWFSPHEINILGGMPATEKTFESSSSDEIWTAAIVVTTTLQNSLHHTPKSTVQHTYDQCHLLAQNERMIDVLCQYQH